MWKTVLYKYNPAVPSRWLLLLAGLMWSGVGVMLCVRAVGWLEAMNDAAAPVLAASGMAFAVAGSRFMFVKTARKNVGRIFSLPERSCVFAFTAWRGYGMIGMMIFLGITLRNSSLPKQYLAPVYLAMGGALLLSSYVFYQSYWNRKRNP